MPTKVHFPPLPTAELRYVGRSATNISIRMNPCRGSGSYISSTSTWPSQFNRRVHDIAFLQSKISETARDYWSY
jgi:hypothetical protein